VSNDGICSFRAANRLSALTSRNIAYVSTIRQNQRDEKVDIPLSPTLPTTDTMASRCQTTSQGSRLLLVCPRTHLTLRLVALPNEPFVSAAPERMASRQGFLEESHERQQRDREDG